MSFSSLVMSSNFLTQFLYHAVKKHHVNTLLIYLPLSYGSLSHVGGGEGGEVGEVRFELNGGCKTRRLS